MNQQQGHSAFLPRLINHKNNSKKLIKYNSKSLSLLKTKNKYPFIKDKVVNIENQEQAIKPSINNVNKLLAQQLIQKQYNKCQQSNSHRVSYLKKIDSTDGKIDKWKIKYTQIPSNAKHTDFLMYLKRIPQAQQGSPLLSKLKIKKKKSQKDMVEKKFQLNSLRDKLSEQLKVRKASIQPSQSQYKVSKSVESLCTNIIPQNNKKNSLDAKKQAKDKKSLKKMYQLVGCESECIQQHIIKKRLKQMLSYEQMIRVDRWQLEQKDFQKIGSNQGPFNRYEQPQQQQDYSYGNIF